MTYLLYIFCVSPTLICMNANAEANLKKCRSTAVEPTKTNQPTKWLYQKIVQPENSKIITTIIQKVK